MKPLCNAYSKSNLTLFLFTHLNVRVDPIFIHITATSFNSNLNNACFLAITTNTRVYISRDIIFDESVYPFSMLHSNIEARLRNEILLLPSHLVDHNGVCLPNNDTTLVDIPNPCSVYTEAGCYHAGHEAANAAENDEGSEHNGAQACHRMEGQMCP
jgi:hypothetical protein